MKIPKMVYGENATSIQIRTLFFFLGNLIVVPFIISFLIEEIISGKVFGYTTDAIALTCIIVLVILLRFMKNKELIISLSSVFWVFYLLMLAAKGGYHGAVLFWIYPLITVVSFIVGSRSGIVLLEFLN